MGKARPLCARAPDTQCTPGRCPTHNPTRLEGNIEFNQPEGASETRGRLEVPPHTPRNRWEADMQSPTHQRNAQGSIASNRARRTGQAPGARREVAAGQRRGGRRRTQRRQACRSADNAPALKRKTKPRTNGTRKRTAEASLY